MAKNWSMGLGRASAMEDKLLRGVTRFKHEVDPSKLRLNLPERAWSPERWPESVKADQKAAQKKEVVV